MPDSNLSTSIAAVKTKITTDAPTATVDEILSLARAAKSVGLSEDAAVESAINSRVLTLSSGATTANMVKLSNAIKQMRDATAASSSSSVDLTAVSTNIIPDTDVTYDLGSSTHKFKDLYLDGNTLNLGTQTIKATATGIEVPELKIGTGTNSVKLTVASDGKLTTTETDSSGNTSSPAAAGGGGSSVTVSDTAPTSPSAGDQWFDSSSLIMFVYYADGSSNQWVPATPAGQTGATGAAGADGNDGTAGYATVVTDMAGLVAITGMVAGQTALVTALNKVFMYTGTAWYLIATMTNDSPTAITGVDGSYTLATDGTATTITAVSTDPEGFPLTWSYAVTTGSLGSTATVSQADNVFTVTPSTTEADAGSFSITFSVTDGATGAVSAVSSFTLSFIVQNSRYTALSVKATNTGSNQTFDDASTSNHTITANGDITTSTFSPYRHGGYSTYLGTQTSRYYSPSSSDFDIGGTGDWSYEAWVYADNQTFPSYTKAFGLGPFWNDPKSFGVMLSDANASNNITVYWSDAAALGGKLTSSTAFSQEVWHHLLVCRSGNDIALFLDGTRIAHNNSYTSSIDSGNTYLFVGHTGFGTEGFMGHIRDVRFINGSHLYDASASSITVPTEPPTAITNTKFLLGDLPYFKDQSASNHAITFDGNVSLEPKSVYDNAPYSEADHGASVHFGEANGNAIIIPTTAATTTGDYTIEFWIRYNTNKSGRQTLSAVDGDHRIVYNAGRFIDWRSGGTQTYWQNADGTLYQSERPGIWTHFAQTRTSGVVKAWINGVGSANTVTDTTSWATSRFGSEHNSSSENFEGDMADIRITHSAIYSSDFTPPTAPLTAITNTKFLLNPETSISDLSQRNALICLGDLETSTTQVKFAGTKSIYFAGSDDYIHVPNSGTNSAFSLNSTKFTIEGWFYKETLGNFHAIISKYRWANNLSWSFDHLDGGNFRFRYSTDGSNFTDLTSSNSSRLFTGAWGHVALVANDDLKLYIDGVGEVLSSSALPTFFDTSYDVLIGALRNDNTDNNDGAKIMEYNGWMQDFRIHNNHAQYTANFTPPTAELEG